MNTSLIISTYNWREALHLTLLSVAHQTVYPSEIIIGDDGSREEIGHFIESFKSRLPVPVVHIWHEDQGFRLAKIRNRAIAAAKGDYIISIDGDLVLDKHFIEDHIKFARRNSFVQGGRVLLPKQFTERMMTDPDTAPIQQLSYKTPGAKNRKNAIRNALLTKLCAWQSQELSRIRGCNQAFFREDLIRVNGLNEAFNGWGREDSELAVRFYNAGLTRRNLKFAGVAYHLYHPEADKKGLNENDALLESAIKGKLSYCDLGLDQYL